MKPKEPIEVRRKMADMHTGFRDNLSELMKSKNYIAASWICYSIFEQRTNRLMQKHIDQCTRSPFYNNKVRRIASISVKLKCLKCLVSNKYGGYADFDRNLLDEILVWCEKRNSLTHQLINLDNYQDYNERFRDLAESGAKLVDRLYAAATKFRQWFSASNQFSGEFPVPKSKNVCDRKYHCVPEEGDIDV